MPLLCEMTNDEKMQYTRSVWDEVGEPDADCGGVGCPHCNMIQCVPTKQDVALHICDECGKTFSVNRVRFGFTDSWFYYATL